MSDPSRPPMQSSPPRRLVAFLCHASSDKPLVRTLYKRLQAEGIQPWFDEEDLLPGQDWQREIARAVSAADVVIVCLSNGSVNQAGYVQKEIRSALDVADEQPEGTIFLIPLRLEVCEVPDRLNRWQWVNYYEVDGFERLMRSLRARATALGLPVQPAQTGDGGVVSKQPVPVPAYLYRGGPLLSTAEIFTVFWGTAWEQSQQSEIVSYINEFFDVILTSSVVDQLAEYSVPGYAIAHGSRVGTITLSKPVPRRSISDGTIQRILRQEISTNAAFPQPTPNTLYFLYFPSDVTVTQGGARSGQAFCSYHNDVDGKIFYVVVPFPDKPGCTGGLAIRDALTTLSSNELFHAITDPIPGEGWYDDSSGEIGNACAWRTKRSGEYIIQLVWSNRFNRCV
jgi:hypothetical protein